MVTKLLMAIRHIKMLWQLMKLGSVLSVAPLQISSSTQVIMLLLRHSGLVSAQTPTRN